MGDIMPRARLAVTAVSARVTKQQREIMSAAAAAQTAIAAIEQVTQAGMFAVVRVKSVQRVLELQVPEAAELLNLVATNGGLAIAQAVQRLGTDVA